MKATTGGRVHGGASGGPRAHLQLVPPPARPPRSHRLVWLGCGLLVVVAIAAAYL